MDLLHVIDGDKSHYVYIKYFNRFMFHEKENVKTNNFVKVVCGVLVVKMCEQNIKIV